MNINPWIELAALVVAMISVALILIPCLFWAGNNEDNEE